LLGVGADIYTSSYIHHTPFIASLIEFSTCSSKRHNLDPGSLHNLNILFHFVMEEIPLIFRPKLGSYGEISYLNLFDRSFLPVEEEWLRKVLVEDESMFDTLCERYLLDKFILFQYTMNYQLLESNIEVSADVIDEIGMNIIKMSYDSELDESTIQRIERYTRVIAEQIAMTSVRSSSSP